MNFQKMYLELIKFWAAKGCIVLEAYDVEKGAGTMSPHTFLRAIGPEPWSAVYMEPSRRPADGRFGENPNRLYQHHQLQVLIKPSPDEIQDWYLESLKAIGIDPSVHDIRFVEDNWEAQTLGAWGLGWEVWLDGMEVTQFTYFQQIGGLNCDIESVEITYGLERLAMYIQDVDNVYDLMWNDEYKYGDIFHQPEYEHSVYSFNEADIDVLRDLFDKYEGQALVNAEKHLIFPAYDYILKCSHTFSVLDARGAIGVSERANFIARVRNMARNIAKQYYEKRKELEFPLLKDGGK